MLTARDESLLTFPLWDLDAIACERRHLAERRAAILDHRRVALLAIQDEARRGPASVAPEVIRAAAALLTRTEPLLAYLDALEAELDARAQRH